MKDGRPEVGLVLEGGAMRGLFTAGVLDVWLERGIHVDRIAAVSAGAAFGCNFVSGQAGRVRYAYESDGVVRVTAVLDDPEQRLPEGVYDVTIVTETLNPISFLLD